MPVLGDLIVKIKVEGEGAAVSSIQRVNQTASNTGRNFASANVSATQLFATLARGSGSATTGLVNTADGVKVVNTNFLDLIQTVTSLTTLWKVFNLETSKPNKNLQKAKDQISEFASFRKRFSGVGKSGPSFLYMDKDEFEQLITGLPSEEYLKRNFIKKIATIERIKKEGFKRGIGKPRFGVTENVNIDRDAIKGIIDEKSFEVISQGLKEKFFGSLKKEFGLLGAYGYKAITSLIGPAKSVLSFFQNNAFGKAISGAAGAMGNLISMTAKFYAGVFSVAIPALTAIAMAASEAAANLEIMRTKMSATLMGQGMTQSQAGVASVNMMGAIKQLSEPSVYTAQQIGEASQRMEAFGLNSIKTLKTGLKLAEVFGGMPDDLEMVVRMFGRMASGDLPDIEVLSRFGISKSALNKAGGGNLIDMSTGKLSGSAEQGVAALAKLIEDRYSKLDEGLANTFNAKKATLQEKFTSLLEVVGKPINEALMKVMGPLSQFIQQLVDSGAAESFGQAIAGVISAFGEPGNAESFKQFGLFLIAFLQEAAMELKKFVSGFAGFLDLLRGAALALTNIGTFGLSGFTTGTGLPEMASGLGKILNPKNYLNIPQFFGMNVFERQKEIQGKLGKKTGAATDYLGMFESDKFIKNAEEQTNQLEEIKNNTGRAADALELRKANLGGRGGPLAQLGMGINVNQAGTTAGVMRAALPPSFALLNPVNQLQKSIQMEVFRTTNQQYVRRY